MEFHAARAMVYTTNLTLDTSQYAAGDVLGNIVEVTNAIRKPGFHCRLDEVVVIDKDDQGAAFDLVIFDRTFTQATKNSAWDTADADMDNCQGIVRVGSSDFVDLGANRVAHLRGLNIILKPSSTSVFIGSISQGTGTYSAAGVRITLKFTQE